MSLFTPKWLLSHVVILALAVTMVFLGLWQLDRHRERLELNETTRSRLSAPVRPLAEILSGDPDIKSIEYYRASVSGTFAPQDEVLVRSQVHLGSGGFHVVTPLVVAEDSAVLVNRGWVPVFMDRVPVEHAGPPGGEVTIEGWIQPGQQRPALGPQDPDTGRLVIVSRIDIDRIGQQVDYDLEPVYLVLIEAGEGLPEQVRFPDFDETGPHLGYAIQWFGFALVGVVGYFFLIRRGLNRGNPRD